MLSPPLIQIQNFSPWQYIVAAKVLYVYNKTRIPIFFFSIPFSLFASPPRPPDVTKINFPREFSPPIGSRPLYEEIAPGDGRALFIFYYAYRRHRRRREARDTLSADRGGWLRVDFRGIIVAKG